MTNLDYICAKTGQDLAKVEENIIRKALGVIREDGVYAMFLWLENKDENKTAREELTKLLNHNEIKNYLLTNNKSFSQDDFNSFIKDLTEVTQDIDKLFFLKKILERTLTYGLYHSKLNPNKKDSQNVE